MIFIKRSLWTGQKWLFFLVGSLFLSGNFPLEIPDASDSNWEQMLRHCLQEERTVHHTILDTNPEMCRPLAIVAPELIRYSLFRDYFETSALEALYIQYGTDGADFSIGKFQMKPSFVEQLEKAILDDKALLSKYHAIVCNTGDLNMDRRKRLDLLKKPESQLLYAKACWDVLEKAYPAENFANMEEQVHFFASAYNLGFYKSEAEITAFQKQKAFPFGPLSPDEQTAFGDLAVYAYLTLKTGESNSVSMN
ncbi:MAG: hypothetical protein R2792_10830 [Saprospiraceae bacterium]